jgi:hypothetical protein
LSAAPRCRPTTTFALGPLSQPRLNALASSGQTLGLGSTFRWSKGGKQYGSFHLAELTLPLDTSRAPTTLSLPNNPTLKILAATVSR